MIQLSRHQDMKRGRATSRTSPPRIYRRTISSTSSTRQDVVADSGRFAITATTASTLPTDVAAASSTITTSNTGAASQKTTRSRQPMKRRTQRSHTDQLFAQTAPIAQNEYDYLGLGDEEMEAYAAESDSLVQALTLSNSPRAQAIDPLSGAMSVQAARGSKTLLKAKGQSREKGLDKRKSRSKNASCSQQ